MAGFVKPSTLVVRAYHRNIGATMTGQEDWRPDDWRRPEFNESQNARNAREYVYGWISQEQGLVRVIQEFARYLPGELAAPHLAGEALHRHAAGEVLAEWVDGMLYGNLKAELDSKYDMIGVQLCADAVARADVCRMDVGALMDDVLAIDLPEPDSVA